MEMKSLFAVWSMFHCYYVYLFDIFFIISYLSIENATVWYSTGK